MKNREAPEPNWHQINLADTQTKNSTLAVTTSGERRAAVEGVREAAKQIQGRYYSVAVEFCEQAIKLDPSNEDAHLLRLEAHRLINKPSTLSRLNSYLEFLVDGLVYLIRDGWWNLWSRSDPFDSDEIKETGKPRFREDFDLYKWERTFAKERIEFWLAMPDHGYIEADQETIDGEEAEELLEANASLRAIWVNSHILKQAPIHVDPAGTWGSTNLVLWRKPIGWMEVADGPIRWITLTDNQNLHQFHEYQENVLLVPDPRITANTPHVLLPHPAYSLFHRIRNKGIRWESEEPENPAAEELSRIIANALYRNEALIQGIKSVGFGPQLETFPEAGCWAICDFGSWTREWSRPLWDFYQAIAEALLVIPLPETITTFQSIEGDTGYT